MEYITKETAEKLASAGFTYPDYQHLLNQGMVFYHQDTEYFVGGYCNRELSEEARTAVQEGLWLPDDQQLLDWLRNNSFDISIEWSCEEWYFHVHAKDCINQTAYQASGPDLANALAKLIYKICKSAQRSYIPESTLRLEIEKGAASAAPF